MPVSIFYPEQRRLVELLTSTQLAGASCDQQQDTHLEPDNQVQTHRNMAYITARTADTRRTSISSRPTSSVYQQRPRKPISNNSDTPRGPEHAHADFATISPPSSAPKVQSTSTPHESSRIATATLLSRSRQQSQSVLPLTRSTYILLP